MLFLGVDEGSGHAGREHQAGRAGSASVVHPFSAVGEDKNMTEKRPYEQPQYDEKKLTELILYIGGKCALDPHYGVLKLNKILFYSDFTAFKTRGRAITGAEYRKYPHGPAPKDMKRLKKKLKKKDEVFEYVNPMPGFDDDGEQLKEKRLFPMRRAKTSVFEPEEIIIVDAVLERLRPMTGRAVSRMSHGHPGWRRSRMEAAIPYFTAFLTEDGPGPLSIADMRRAKEVAKRYRDGQYSFHKP